jgi:signal transduction histidine kinase
VYPEYPPRVRLEWLIASARLALAAVAVAAAATWAFRTPEYLPPAIVSAGYLVYSLLVLALVWAPVRFAVGWDLAVHIFDLAAFSVLILFTAGEASPFFAYYTFVVVCGTLRWQVRGAFLTACAATLLYAATTAFAIHGLHLTTFTWSTFAIRSAYLAVVAMLVGYMGGYQRQYQREIGRLASWPRKIPPDANALVGEVLAECAEIMDAPRVLLLWEEPGEGYLNVALRTGDEVAWTHEPEAAYGSIVIPGLEGKNFQAGDCADENGVVVHSSTHGFQQRRGRPLNASFHRRFAIRSAQSWTLDGELIRGRLFCLDKPQVRLDDLAFGVLVARLAVSRLDSLYLVKHLRNAAAFEERLRVARDLHDSLLQSVAGAALQLLAARRLLERDPVEAAKRLEDVQNQLERGEIDMRAFINRLRPSVPSRAVDAGLKDRLAELRDRVERQWGVKVKVLIDTAAEEWPPALASNVYRIIQEGLLNAARHADASVIGVYLAAADGGLRLEIVDDGRGFPFQGTYDLNALNELNRGPLTLKERVAELNGDLKLRSMETGTELLIRLPLAKVAG